MKKILKFFLLSIFFIFCLIYLFPKENLYFYGEKKLQDYKIIISNETLSFDIKGVHLKNFDLYYDKVKIAKIEKLDLNFSLFDFDQIALSLQSKELGQVQGKFNLLKLRFDATFNPTEKIKERYKSLLKELKIKNGAYLYEYKL